MSGYFARAEDTDRCIYMSKGAGLGQSRTVPGVWSQLAMLRLRAMLALCSHMAMGQNSVLPVNIPIPTKLD